MTYHFVVLMLPSASSLHYFVKGLNNFKIYYEARDIDSGILIAKSAPHTFRYQNATEC
jgi:hypothetical protein